ncbi:hypothetical protein BDV26DRAFT_12837 [Aspergillus bertholletiae]|uniref:Uncharacterized protein n=1 Tax=Aspergillus bertholletiae TaxID=1226010 RepID=A0A5N7B0B3_9EURO|nr:hypothetical protein BDV26DRAFT_12837 [Aspergillus bertholletiae]
MFGSSLHTHHITACKIPSTTLPFFFLFLYFFPCPISFTLISWHSIVPVRTANRDREKLSNSEALRLVYCGAFNSCMKYSGIVLLTIVRLELVSSTGIMDTGFY